MVTGYFKVGGGTGSGGKTERVTILSNNPREALKWIPLGPYTVTLDKPFVVNGQEMGANQTYSNDTVTGTMVIYVLEDGTNGTITETLQDNIIINAPA